MLKYKVYLPNFDRQTGKDNSEVKIVEIYERQQKTMVRHWEQMGYVVEQIKQQAKSSEDGQQSESGTNASGRGRKQSN